MTATALQFPLRPTLVPPQPEAAELRLTKRTKIWEFNANLHCSIIGTCLSTGELRQVLGKLGLASPGATDHELHGTAVSLSSRHDQAAKLLHKALDGRHRVTVSQFAKATTEPEVRKLWREAVGRGDIPGAYWAALTHPATTNALVREAFGEVHMLSHLVGAANRADIRRLRELETQQTELQARLERQQSAFQTAVVERDTRIRELGDALAAHIGSDSESGRSQGDEAGSVLRALVADLEKRLAVEARRRAGAEDRLATALAALEEARDGQRLAAQEASALGAELTAIEASLSGPEDDAAPDIRRLDGVSLLYVGGRANQCAHLRAAASRLGADFLHHDGGKEQHQDLLPGLVSRADLVLFPVDCISHDAALAVKRLCRQMGRGFVPLRTASLGAFVAALQRVELNPAEAAAAE